MTFWIKVGIALFLLGCVLVAKHRYDEGIRDEVRAKEVAPLKAAWEADKAKRLHDYAKLMTDYVAAQQEAENKQEQINDLLAKQKTARHVAVDAIPRSIGDVRVPVVAGVLNHDTAIGPGHGAATGASAESKPDPAGATTDTDTTVALWAGWSATMIDLYDSCRTQVIGLIDYYNGLRTKHVEEQL